MPGAELAFDHYAAEYDAHFTASAIGKLQRERVWKMLREIDPSVFPEVLEIGCGTGEDARWFAKRGFNVTATDASEGMTGIAKEKLQREKLSAAVICCRAEDLAQQFSRKQFDFIFSDFGALNCLSPEAFQTLSNDLAGMLRPGGKLVLVIMGRDCRWEQWYFRRKGELEKANRRKRKDGVETVIDGETFFTWYYSPEEVSAFFAKHFTVDRIRPVGYFLPPSYLENYFSKRPLRLRMLALAERLFPFSILAGKADHFFIECTKR